jgi:hypothetical protein
LAAGAAVYFIRRIQSGAMKSRKQETAGAVDLEQDQTGSQENSAPVPASEVLKAMLNSLPPDHFTLSWLSSHLHRRSFGVIVLILALIAMVPGISYLAGLLLLAPAIEMMAGRKAPTFPGRIGNHPFSTRHLAFAVRRAVPLLSYLERVIRPRWKIPVLATTRVVGLAVFLLTALLLLTPLPFIQVVPGIVIVVLSVAYLEDDGLFLFFGLLATLVLVILSAGAVWGMIAGAKLLGWL